MAGGTAPPPIGNLLREGLAIPRLLVNPLRRPRPGPAIGRGRPVIVIPGLATGDISTKLLRRTLNARGFVAEGWGLGLNTGADPDKLAKLKSRVAQLHRESGMKVLVIGWSLGGLFARILGHRSAEQIAMVVTVASPFSGDRKANHAWRVYNAINDHTVDNPPFAEELEIKPDVPTLAVWSGTDGMVAPECCCGTEDQADYTLRHDAQHFKLGTSRAAIDAILAKISETGALDAD